MYWLDIGGEDRRPSSGTDRHLVHAYARGRYRDAPLIGVTTSEVRRGELATLRRHGEPPHHEMALGLTYMRAIERAGGLPVVLPPLHDGSRRAVARPPRRHLPVRRPGPRPRRLRRARRATSELGPTEPPSTASSSRWRAPADAAGLPLLGVCRGAQALNVARGGTLHQHVEGHRQSELATEPMHAVRDRAALAASAAPARPARRWTSTPSTTRRSTSSATAWRSPRGPTDGTVEAIEDRTPPVLRSASSGTPRRWSTPTPSVAVPRARTRGRPRPDARAARRLIRR